MANRDTAAMRNEGLEFVIGDGEIQSCICQYCGSPMKESEELSICTKCKTPHHKECFKENEKCTTYGCGNKTAGSAEFKEGKICRKNYDGPSAGDVHRALEGLAARNGSTLSKHLIGFLREKFLIDVLPYSSSSIKERLLSNSMDLSSIKRQASVCKDKMNIANRKIFWAKAFSFFDKRRLREQNELKERLPELNRAYQTEMNKIKEKTEEIMKIRELMGGSKEYTVALDFLIKLTERGIKRRTDLCERYNSEEGLDFISYKEFEDSLL